MASFVCLILCSVGVLGAWGGNVDTLEPVVRGLPAQYASASQDFGYQALLHLLSVPGPQAGIQDFVSQARIIVGAPKGIALSNSLDTGLVYVCPLDPGPCELLTNNTGELADSMLGGNTIFNASNPMYEVEQKQGQLLGASMATSGDTFMVCAPLYTQVRREQVWYTGKCFLSGRSLQNFSSFESCQSETPSSVVQCSTGVSLAGASGLEGFLLGVPMYSGFGRVVAYENGRLNEDITGGQATLLAQRGFQVAYGHITSTAKEQYVTVEYGATAVRGRVIVVDPDTPTSSIQGTTINGPTLVISPNAMINRPTGIGAGFGYALATAKIADKAYDSILVSAPFASEGYEQAEVGRVYVYRNVGGTLMDVRSTDPPQLMSEKAPFGRFGSSIVNMGDINKDGYDDVAVSAPYEGRCSAGMCMRTGVVYIYYSKADGSGLNPEYVQRIEGDNLNTGALQGLVGFGSTLSSGVDVDGNKYNDLLVGSFESQKVVVLRTRPIVNVDATLAAILRGVNETLNLDVFECDDHPCFDVRVCLTVKPTGVNGTAFEGDNVAVKYTLVLEEELVAMGITRSFFEDGGTQRGTLERIVMVPNDRTSVCLNHTVFIAKGITDRSSAFVVSLQVQNGSTTPSQTDGNQPITDLNARPVVIISGKHKVAVEPEKNCGDDGICMPRLSVKVVDVTYGGNGDTFDSFVAGEVTQITVWVQVNNSGEDSFSTSLISTFNGEVFTRSQILNLASSDCVDMEAEQNSTVDTTSQCSIGNPLRTNDFVTPGLKFLLRQADREFTESSFTMTFNVTTNGMDQNLADNSDVKIIMVNRKADLRISRIAVPDRALLLDSTFTRPATLTSLSELGPHTTIQVDVFNDGPSLAPGATLTITWPLSTTSGSYILYPSSLTADPEVSCSMDNIDPEDLNLPSRRRRQATTGLEGVPVVGDVSLDCNNTAVKCVTIVCDLGRMPSKTRRSVTINSSLDVSFFEDKPNMNVRIPVEATVRVVADYPIENPPSRDTLSGSVVAVYTPAAQTPVDTTLIIAIIVPIVVVIIFLAIVVILMYLLGIFKRKHPSQTYSTTKVEEVAPEVEDEGSPSAAEKKALEAEGGCDEPDVVTKSPSLTSLDISPEKPKPPETDV